MIIKPFYWSDHFFLLFPSVFRYAPYSIWIDFWIWAIIRFPTNIRYYIYNTFSLRMMFGISFRTISIQFRITSRFQQYSSIWTIFDFCRYEQHSISYDFLIWSILVFQCFCYSIFWHFDFVSVSFSVFHQYRYSISIFRNRTALLSNISFLHRLHVIPFKELNYYATWYRYKFFILM